ncbi:DUF2860 family protein [Desulfoluna sp.]|uniref:DUF2860 family protein n=1 Tax=Desulfoluna sp. TaxID=2045199 RepID=UPI00261A0A49|nr:DUF2860 family protein [Desulfoluna sp.]
MITWKRKRTHSSAARGLCLIILLLALVTPEADAASPRDKAEPGFQSDIKVMAGVIHLTKPVNAVSDENKLITSLDTSSSSETEFIPIIIWNLNYTFDNRKTALFAGTPNSNIVEGTYFLEVGARHQLDNGTALSLSWIPELPLLDDEVWKDPFLTGKEREETDRTSQGFQFKAESLLGSPFFLTYAFGTSDIEDEESGQAYTHETSTPLSHSDLQALKRSGDAHLIETGLRIPVSQSIILGTTLDLLCNEAEGKAHRFNKVGGKVSVIVRHPICQAFSTLSFHQADYDGTHPVFGKKREDRSYSASLGIEAPLRWGRDNLSFSMLIRVSRTDSNLDFYEGETAMAGMGVTYRF